MRKFAVKGIFFVSLHRQFPPRFPQISVPGRNFYFIYSIKKLTKLNHGFCDMFLMPDLQHYPDIEHSYILKLKYLPKEKFDKQAAEQWNPAVKQIHGYAEGTKVQQLCI